MQNDEWKGNGSKRARFRGTKVFYEEGELSFRREKPQP
jgi:hypothetical protein